ncbi:putative Major facilitator superfamily domain-containing protein [Seiridium cardinale]|uniref:Major facilitator superfamily domain-containing protein n=1 Tax=Seiridium cardinale TaxID=138064 RepID=A0ABR2XTF8_9PEZI
MRDQTHNTTVAAATEAEREQTKVTAGEPREQLQVDEPGADEDVVYPTGVKLWSAMASIFTVSLLHGLDLTIVAAAVPSVTDQFRAIEDIGWYSSAYSVMAASFGFLFGKLYTQASAKWLYLISLACFELGSLFCTVAPTSWFFILGRAIAGIGAAGTAAGLLVFFGFQEIVTPPVLVQGLSWKEKAKKVDILGTLIMIPTTTCLFLALQWGGIRIGWSDVRIIVLFVLFACFLAAFAWRQYVLQDAGTLPPRIFKMRSVLTGTWYTSCVNSTLAVTEYYITIYFQGIKGFTATQSGVLMLPMLLGVAIGSVCGGIGIVRIGYYNPFMIATSVLAPVASGLLTTVSLDDNLAKALCLLGFLGLAVGIGLQTPIISLQTVMRPADLSIGIASLYFGATMGNAVWIVVSAALFQNRLVAEVASHSPTTNATLLENAGLSQIRKAVGEERLRDVLLGYDTAVTQTLYLPVGLCVATVIGSALAEWQSVKKKKKA